MSKLRLDQLLVTRGLFDNRAAAKAAVMAGKVRLGGQVINQAGKQVEAEAVVEVAETGKGYASRAGKKLEAALDEFFLDVAGKTVLDAGSSTGGFVDCLLSRGAAKVIAVDVGYGLLVWSLRQDPRVEVHERTNLRYIRPEDISGPVHLVTLDLSFISLEKALPAAQGCLCEGGTVLALVKPQFEVGKGKVGKGGIVRDSSLHREALEKVATFAIGSGLIVHGAAPSVLPGAKGNVEYWLLMSSAGQGLSSSELNVELDKAIRRGAELID